MKASKAITTHTSPVSIEQDLKSLGKDLLKYEDYVEMGKELVKRTEAYQARIAFYACRVCQIRHGGRSDKFYTLTDYAKDIGVPHKSLQQWTLTYRNVIERLDIPVDNITKEVWKIANRVNDNLSWRNRRDNHDNKTPRTALKYKREIPVSEVHRMYKEESGGDGSFESELRGWGQYVRLIKNKIFKRDLTLGHPGNLLELMNMMDDISDHINNFLTKLKKKENK